MELTSKYINEKILKETGRSPRNMYQMDNLEMIIPETGILNGAILGVDNFLDEVAATSTAQIGKISLVNTTAAARTVNPPANPVAGSTFAVIDSRSNAGTNNITVDFTTASQPFYAAAANDTLSTNGASVTYLYVNDTIGWVKL